MDFFRSSFSFFSLRRTSLTVTRVRDILSILRVLLFNIHDSAPYNKMVKIHQFNNFILVGMVISCLLKTLPIVLNAAMVLLFGFLFLVCPVLGYCSQIHRVLYFFYRLVIDD